MTADFTIGRRTFLAGAGAALAASALPRPALAQNARANTLRFIPQADLAIIDPLTTTAYSTRNHGHLCWDTLYGIDENFVPQPQLAEGHTVADDGKRWTITMRDGPTFHDGEKILAKDAVASIQRWMLRDTHGQTLAALLEEIRVIDDRRFELRLKRPFGSLLAGLGKASSYPCFIFPERFAKVDPVKGFTEVVGSGPYRFVAGERVAGAQIVYSRYDKYSPTPVGNPSMIAGPKLAHFERLEWHIIPDSSTAASAMQTGEQDWFELVPNDLDPLLKRARNLNLEVIDAGGYFASMRFNQLHAPFDDPAVRRAVLAAVKQSDFMEAVAGDKANWREGVGFFPVGSPFASDVGMAALTGPRDIAAAKAAVAAAGKAGAKVTVLHATDVMQQNALGSVAVETLGKLGFSVDDVAMDFGTLVQRRAKKDAPDKGGWSVITTLFGGADFATPAGHLMLRGNGAGAWFGWPEAPKLEELRNAWFDAPDLEAQKKIAAEIQKQAFQDVPFVPLGQFFSKSAYRNDLTGVRKGMVLPLNVKRG